MRFVICCVWCREWLRHQKTQGLPEPLATPSQLARMRELQLPVTGTAAATLTYTQVSTEPVLQPLVSSAGVW